MYIPQSELSRYSIIGVNNLFKLRAYSLARRVYRSYNLKTANCVYTASDNVIAQAGKPMPNPTFFVTRKMG